MKKGPRVIALPELADEIQNKTDENADNDAGGQGEIEREILALDKDITGKLPQERQLLDTEQYESNDNKNDPDDNDDPGDFAHNTLTPRKSRESCPGWRAFLSAVRSYLSCRARAGIPPAGNRQAVAA